MEVYKIVELDQDAKDKGSKFEFVSIENDQSIDVEYLVENSQGETEHNSSSPLPIQLSHIDSDIISLDEVEITETTEVDNFKEDAMQQEDEHEQDAVSFLLGNSHLLEKIEDFSSRGAKGATATNGVNRPHICKVCSKSFLRKSNLVDHLRLHADVRLYQCEYCDKSFVQAGNFKSHLRIHTKERPYKCTMCPKTYNQSSALKVSLI